MKAEAQAIQALREAIVYAMEPKRIVETQELRKMLQLAMCTMVNKYGYRGE